jgi:hypothetical protein
MNPREAKYVVWQEGVGDTLVTFLTDECDGCVSVTNDAEEVVRKVLQEFSGQIVYRDTDGRWDELVHDGVKFTGFGATTLRPKKHC